MERSRHGCDSFQESLRLTRRQALCFGVAAPTALAAASAQGATVTKPRARSILMLYLFGGYGQLDTFDMKPEAPPEVRGLFRPIATPVPGLDVCEHFPKVARIMDKVTVVRSMQHDRNVHGGAVVYSLTGGLNRDPGIPGVRGPDASKEDPPNIGSVVRLLGRKESGVPNAIALPWRMIDGQGREPPGQKAGLLGPRFDPWLVDSDPNLPTFQITGLAMPAEVPLARFTRRSALMDAIDQRNRFLDRLPEVEQVSDLQRQARRLMGSERVRQAFSLGEEPPRLRDAYGRNTFGQACLLGRRLIEADVPYVQVNMGPQLFGTYGWDTHSNTFPTMKDHLCPKFDSAFATLMADMESRGLLDETLVIVNTEFGRKPFVSRNGGRDHWPSCYSLLFAGAGVCRGKIVGKSDSRAAYPVTNPYSPADVAATLFDAVGIDPEVELRSMDGRPIPLTRGRVIHEIFS